MIARQRAFALLILMFLSSSGFGAVFQRWTYEEQTAVDLSTVLAELSKRTSWTFKESDFRQVEDRELAFSHYQRLVQIRRGVPIAKAALRIWTDKQQVRALQVEANVENPADQGPMVLRMDIVNGQSADRIRQQLDQFVSDHVAELIRNVQQDRVWQGSQLVERVSVKTDYGHYRLVWDALTGKLLTKSFKPHPTADAEPIGEFSLSTRTYPIYEEYRGLLLATEPGELKYLHNKLRMPTTDPYAVLREQKYLYSKLNPALAATAEGRAQGYWSFSWLNAEASRLAQAIPYSANDFAGAGLTLEGRYATVSLHPLAPKAYGPLPFEPRLSDLVNFDSQEVDDGKDFEVIPTPSYRSKPWKSAEEIAAPLIERDPENNPARYIAAGFDDIQVYSGITKLFDTLRPMGFIDPDLGDRPFHAILYNPDIGSRDNAFYADDSINFASYSPNGPNLARDNTTIWHELGHGVMDRLMGSELELADTGGLSEGMADFVAAMVLEGATAGADFPGKDDQRIINNTGFFLTNEAHDDGEAYGGAMKAIMDLGIDKYGRAGLAKICDLVLEAMRLSRDHPHLTADDWFQHVRFADQLGRSGVRESGELASIIDEALARRNFAPESERATFSLKYDDHEVDGESIGSRGNEVPLSILPTETAQLTLKVRLTDGAAVKLKYPVTIKVFYNSGPLQGAIDWVSEGQEPNEFVLNAPGEELQIPLGVNGTCDSINRRDGSCSDFAYVQVYEQQANMPVAKKRFYVRLKAKTQG